MYIISKKKLVPSSRPSQGYPSAKSEFPSQEQKKNEIGCLPGGASKKKHTQSKRLHKCGRNAAPRACKVDFPPCSLGSMCWWERERARSPLSPRRTRSLTNTKSKLWYITGWNYKRVGNIKLKENRVQRLCLTCGGEFLVLVNFGGRPPPPTSLVSP